MTASETKLLFRHVWIHTCGIGALCAVWMCLFAEEEINEMLGRDFMTMLILVKYGGLDAPTGPMKPTQARSGSGHMSQSCGARTM